MRLRGIQRQNLSLAGQIKTIQQPIQPKRTRFQINQWLGCCHKRHYATNVALPPDCMYYSTVMAGRKPIPIAIRFAGKWRANPSGCWIWTGARNSFGYGLMELHGLGRRNCTGAHRVSWMLHRGEIPPGLNVLHRCDVPACVNPEHLWLGTYKDNMQDSIAKGRANLCRMRGITGSAHPASKFTDDQRAEAHRLRWENGLSYQDIASRIGCNRQTIGRWLRQ